MEVFVTKTAKKKYVAIKEYIFRKWGENSVLAFTQKTKDFFKIIKEYPELGSLEVNDIRGFQLTKQTRVFYRVKGDKVIILTFFDVRQNPKKKIKG